MNNFLHFVSHTHWDREWYMSFESHRIKLVELIDRLLNTLEKDQDFISFHLDGQIIILEDYLEIKPYKIDEIKKYVAEGRLKIGPFYILQDEFLISGEANIRNLLYGMKACKKYGPVCMVGYFPDAFGNISQMPQILKGFGIESTVFGRGINPVGPNNTLLKDGNYKQYHSELLWKSPDGSQVLGVLFANWYNNAWEIPEDKDKAVAYIKEIRDKAIESAATPHLLLMNGCDHEPVQANLPTILKNVQPEFNNDILLHTSLDSYIDEVRKFSTEFETVEGELTEQFTSGMTTLVNTASSRIYLKQLNHKAQTLLEKWVEPLGVMSWLSGDEYRSNFINTAWKYLMQNHPHDSICGCSVDDVHEEMVTRFKKVITLSRELIDREIRFLASSINTFFMEKDDTAIVVFNPLCWKVTELTSFFMDFSEDEAIDPDEVSLFDCNGCRVAANIVRLGRTFTYTLPDDSFRVVRYVNRFKVSFIAENIPEIGYKTYVLKRDVHLNVGSVCFGNDFAENKHIRLDINKNGSLTVTDKNTGLLFKDLNLFEDCGDRGDEYNFIAPENDVPITTSNSNADISVYESGSEAVTFKVANSIMLPASYDKMQGKRSKEEEQFTIISYITISACSRRVDISTEFDNNCSDHRLRALFPAAIKSEFCHADGQFDIIQRPVSPWKGWENPSNCQRQQAFVSIHDEKQGLAIANKGLPEYEILCDGKNTIALTLVRSVGEMGDWGDFPTPEAQCLGMCKTEYSIIPYAGETDKENAFRQAYQFNTIPLETAITGRHSGILEPETSLIGIESETLVLSAFKKCEDQEGAILRMYNTSSQCSKLSVDLTKRFKGAFFTNLNEERQKVAQVENGKICVDVPSKKIITLELERG